MKNVIGVFRYDISAPQAGGWNCSTALIDQEYKEEIYCKNVGAKNKCQI
jgi:hypothetical protein